MDALDKTSKGISYIGGFFILFAFAVAGIALSLILITPVWSFMTGTSILKMQEGMANPAFANAAKVVQTISSFMGFFIPAVCVAWLLNKRPFALLGFNQKITMIQIGFVVAIMITAMAASSGMAYLNKLLPISQALQHKFQSFENDYNDMIQSFLGMKTFGEYAIALFVIAFVAALCEETFFRGGLQNFLTRGTNNKWISIILVSILFSAIHFSFYGFFVRALLGFVLGYIYFYSKNIWLNILGHFINNGLAVTAVFYLTRHGKSLTDAVKSSDKDSWAGLFALPVLVLLLYFFPKYCSPKKNIEANFNVV